MNIRGSSGIRVVFIRAYDSIGSIDVLFACCYCHTQWSSSHYHSVARDGSAGSFRGHTYTLVVYLVISRKLEELESGIQDLAAHRKGVIHSH